MPTLNIFQPSLDDAEADAVREVMRSNWIGRGKLCLDFESRFAEHIGVGADKVLSITSCTEGLFLAMDLLGVDEGDLVIMPSISFIAAANAVVDRGARPLFCDVDKRTLNVRLDDIIDCISSYPYVRKSRFKAVVLLHYGGAPCDDIEEIAAYCDEKGMALIEDSACSVSSSVRGVACGTFGRFGMWSFDAMKILSTGDGGMFYSSMPNDRYRAEKRGFLGLSKASGMSSDPNTPWWEFDIDVPGRRFLMNDLTAAIGIQQLAKLPSFIDRRRQVHELYMDMLDGIDGLLLPPKLLYPYASSHYMYWVQLEDKQTRDDLAVFLRTKDIYTTFRYYPLHWVRYYADRYPSPRLPNAEDAANTTLCIPIHQSMTDDQVGYVCDSIRQFMADRRKT